MIDIHAFWDSVLSQDAEKMRTYFTDHAFINWHCTKEHFTLEEYIQANCEYPGEWDGTIDRIEQLDNLFIVVVNVYSRDRSLSFHVVSFMKTENDRICSLDEYWGDDGPAPDWRLELKSK